MSSRCILLVHRVLKYFNNETLTDGEWQNVETKIVHDILMKFHWEHRNGAGREVGHVVDQIVIQKRQQTRETLQQCLAKRWNINRRNTIFVQFCIAFDAYK